MPKHELEAAFPMLKLGILALKHISKPLTGFIENQANRSTFIRDYICKPPAQLFHWCEVTLKLWTLRMGKPGDIPKLNDNMAIELGANLISETLIFSLAVAAIISEYARQTNKEKVKELSREMEFKQIQETLKDMQDKSQTNTAKIKELSDTLSNIEVELNKKN